MHETGIAGRIVITGVTGQNIPPAGLYSGLKHPRLDYTRVYYGLGQFILRGILWPRPIHTPSGQIIPHDKHNNINSVERYTQELFNLSTSYRDSVCQASSMRKLK